MAYVVVIELWADGECIGVLDELQDNPEQARSYARRKNARAKKERTGLQYRAVRYVRAPGKARK